jgi:dTDP-4-amino-4,6-dideoxygalactose transaminase
LITATKPYFPDKSKFQKYIDGIWESEWLTNNGPLVRQLETDLLNYLEVPNLSFLNNGTVAIQIAMKALEVKGDVITTPFSYVATTSTIVWEQCNPIFVDIENQSYCINPELIESKITDKTTAILATHVYGNPCDVEAIDAIAKKHNLKVIYDAAHAFGVKYKNKSVLLYGDASTLSFHATKLFHTGEGGAVVSPHKDIADVMEYQRRFGHDGPYAFQGVGINAKSSELHAAMGLCVLQDIDIIMKKRKEQWLYYQKQLETSHLSLLKLRAHAEFNYAYFPIRFKDESILLEVNKKLEAANIFTRRYFYPSLNKLNYVNYQVMPVSEASSKTVLCLPLYHDLKQKEQDLIIDLVTKVN